MQQYRKVVRKLIPALLPCTFLLLTALLEAENPTYKQGILVENNRDEPCAYDCIPFEPVYFSFCVQSGNQITLGRIRDFRFSYDPSKLTPLVGKAIQYRNDDKSLWIMRPNGKEFHVKRDYTDGYFVDPRCVAELHRNLLRNTPLPAEPQGVAADATYVPLTLKTGYWTKCFLAADRVIVCFARGPKGEEFSHVYQAIPEARKNSDLAIDPLRTNYDRIVLASGKTLARKYD